MISIISVYRSDTACMISIYQYTGLIQEFFGFSIGYVPHLFHTLGLYPCTYVVSEINRYGTILGCPYFIVSTSVYSAGLTIIYHFSFQCGSARWEKEFFDTVDNVSALYCCNNYIYMYPPLGGKGVHKES